MEIIEDHPSTKRFKYILLSQIVIQIVSWAKNWNGKYFDDNVFCQTVFNFSSLPEIKLKKSEKLDEMPLNRILQKYTQEYLGNFFTVDVSRIPPKERIRVGLKKDPDLNIKKALVLNEISKKIEKLLDELIEKPFSEDLERNILLKEIDKQCETQYRWNTIKLSPSSIEERKHIRIFKTLRDFEKEGLIRMDVDFFKQKMEALDKAWKIEITPLEKLHEYLKEKKVELKGNWRRCGELRFNLDDGLTIYGKAKPSFKPDSREYRLLTALLRNPNKRVSADDLVRIVYKKKKGKASSTDKRNLAFIIKNIKRKLCIIGKNKLKENRDIFKSCNGYKIICE